MDFAYTDKARSLIERVSAFMEQHVYPNERAYHEQIAGYMVKGAVGPQFARLAQLLQCYGSAVRLP